MVQSSFVLLILSVFLCCAFSSANGSGALPRRPKFMDTVTSSSSSGDGDENNKPDFKLGPLPRYFAQKQDHFDPKNTHTWQQAFYVNSTFWTGASSGAPVFLCVGGEGPPLDGSVVVASPHCNVAVEWLRETGALMLAVEHRYYGCHNRSACPYTQATENPLQYLSSRQAIEDLATFHAHAMKEFGLTEQNKWVSFGGSYPGMLAGWFRVKHPELVHASVASSAPVVAILNMRGYNDVTAQAYAVTSVGGSVECRHAIAAGHATIGTMMNTSSGRETLARKFKVSAAALTTHAGKLGFAGNGVAYFPSQGNDPACNEPVCNIEKICDVMTNATVGDEVDRLAMVRNAQSETGLLSTQTEAAMYRRLPGVTSDWTAEAIDYWGYQTCTEFGFYQTCEVGSQCFYSQGLDLLVDNDEFCKILYGITEAEIQTNIDNSNKFYGADHPNATRIFYPNGEVDPWKSQGVLKSPGKELPTLLVAGASHHAWTHPSLPTDQASVVQARSTIRKQVATWLSEE